MRCCLRAVLFRLPGKVCGYLLACKGLLYASFSPVHTRTRGDEYKSPFMLIRVRPW